MKREISILNNNFEYTKPSNAKKTWKLADMYTVEQTDSRTI